MASFPANVYGGGCKRLRERLQCFASEKGKTGTDIASPILDKRVLATFLARTCGKNPAGGVSVNLTSVAPHHSITFHESVGWAPVVRLG